MLGRLWQALGLARRDAASRLRSYFFRRRSIQARYDAASINDDNRRHWANADGLSARSANSAEVRKRLRDRARYEVANNSYAKGIVTTLSNDVIGTGPRLQALTSDNAVNRQVERAFADWSRACRLSEKLATMQLAKTVDGEAFTILTTNPVLPTAVQLDLRLVEAEQISTPMAIKDQNAVDGIVFDSFGNPVEYRVLKEHPGDGFSFVFERLPASAVIHWFRLDRPGQVRGVPEITAALSIFAQCRRYTLAVMAAAETAADFAAFLKTNAPPGGESDSAEPFETLEIEQRMLTTLPAGWDVSQLRAEQPTTSHNDFVREKIGEAARCLNMPRNIALCDSSNYNYASGRLDHQTYFKAIRVERAHCELVVLSRIFAAWLDEAVMIPGLLPRGLSLPDLNFRWFWDGTEHVDPMKEAGAEAVRLQNHTATLAEIFAERGVDWEDALRQRAKEAALMKELGLTLAETQPTPNEQQEASDDKLEEPTA